MNPYFSPEEAIIVRYVLHGGEEHVIVTLTCCGTYRGTHHLGMNVTSGFGSYGYEWHSIGQPDPRRFLISCDADYLYRKLTHVVRVYDGEQTLANVVAAFKATHPDLIDDLGDEFNSLDRIEDFHLWWHNLDNPRFHNDDMDGNDDPQQLVAYKREPQCWTFCEQYLPLLKDRLRQELDAGLAFGCK